MSELEGASKWPALIEQGIRAIGRGVTPGCIKALDRLIGASIDVGVAKLSQSKAKIDAQTQSFVSVEKAIAKSVVAQVGADEEIATRAANTLIRKAYRQQTNREKVAAEALEQLTDPEQHVADEGPSAEPDDDWLNTFERYAEDASSERMQNLWGRVLAGEIRRPGRFSLRTLRFLSEFSQIDAMDFAEFCKNALGSVAPRVLVRENDEADITRLIYLEANGLIQGASGLGLHRSLKFDENGWAMMGDGKHALVFRGVPGSTVKLPVVVLTPLGQELMSLLPERDVFGAAKRVAEALKCPELDDAYFAFISDGKVQLNEMTVIWQKEETLSSEAN